MKRIDKSDIERSSEFTEKYYKEYWGSKELFLNGGFGFCIEQGGMIIAECVSIFRGIVLLKSILLRIKHIKGKD